jgi:MYXO-CTERM domain-containing protein
VTILGAGLLLSVASGARAQSWTAAATLVRPGMPVDSSFGDALSISQNAIMVGAPGETGALTNGGAVYVFSGPNWSDVARIEVSNIVDFEGFGRVLSMDGDRALISNGWIDNAKVWAVEKVGGVWTERQRLQESKYGAFGFRLTMRGDLALIAAPKDGSDNGRVYVYQYEQGTWGKVQELTASDAMVSDFFGYALDYDGQRLVVGASGNLLGPDRTGVYTFSRVGNTFHEDGRIAGVTPLEISFGQFVAVSGDTMVVCAPPGRDRMSNGKAYVYVRSGDAWMEQQQITMAEEEQFPMGARLQRDTLWFGARTGMTSSAVVFRRTGGTWTQVQKVSVPLTKLALPPLALSGGTSAWGISADGVNGSVRVFRNPGEDPPPGSSTGGAGGGGSGGTGSGGTGSGGTGSGGTGSGTGGSPSATDGTSGCSCTVASGAPTQGRAWLLGFLLVVALRRPRR